MISVSYDTKPTAEYARLQAAYDYFNDLLFAGMLPDCLITLQRHRGARGYFWSSIFQPRGDDQPTDEIALNPEAFDGRTDRQILSTLAHEMCHLWQAHYGDASRAGYHNKEWGRQMKAIGLYPSHTGAPGGKETGQAMTHYIVDGGPFDLACTEFLATGFAIRWQAGAKASDSAASSGGDDSGDGDGAEPAEPAAKNPKNKVKYSCPECKQNAWAKPGAKLMCGACYVSGAIVPLTPQE